MQDETEIIVDVAGLAEQISVAGAGDESLLGPVVLPLIDGVPAGGTGPTLSRVDPATGRGFARMTLAGPEDIERAVDSAAHASALWKGTAFKERGRSLRRLAQVVREQAWGIAELVAREQGKPRVEAMNLEVLPALDHLGFMIRHAEKYHAGLTVEPRHPFYVHKRSLYLYDPIGVVAMVTPSTLPFAIPLIQVAAALAMGNAVILKPSHVTPLCGMRVGELCTEAGFPHGLVNVVPAQPEDSLRLVAHPKVNKVFFTGSIEVGKNVMATAGCAPRPVVLSLGGKHPSIVAGDADLGRAARGIVWGAMSNAGQNCGAVERVYVEECVASRFLELVLSEVDALRVGNPLENGVDLGPLVSDERRTHVHWHVLDAVERGAKLLRGGVLPEGPGYFYPPTVLMAPATDCRLMREETLGPVLPIVVVESLERAILLANDSEFALTASGWTRSPETAERLMIGLHAGVVTINDVLYSFGEPAATWSGYRKSGVGQNHGTPGLREMCRQKFVSFDPLRAEAPAAGYPYDDEATHMARNAVDYLHAPRPSARLRALFRLLRLRRSRKRLPLRWLLLPRRRPAR